MQKLYFLPDDRTILDCLANDILDRNADVVSFCTVLDSCHECTVISLDGAWGSGKTFFVKQAKMLLDVFCDNSELNTEIVEKLGRIKLMNSTLNNEFLVTQKHTTIYFDAWENDKDSDPILSIIYATLKSEQVALNISKQKDVKKIISSIAECVTGRNITTFFDSLNGKDLMAELKEADSIESLMRKFLDAAIGNQNDRLVVFIDELDRCKPTYAIALLERIKHFFTDERVTFVFSINQNQLQHTVKSYYGYGMDASKYLEKCFDISIPLPEANIKHYIDHLGFKTNSYSYDRVYFSVIRYCHFGLREISKLLLYLKMTTYDLARDKNSVSSISFDNAKDFCLKYITPILVGLRLYDITKYSMFINGNFANPLIEILTMTDIGIERLGYLINSKEVLETSYSKNLVGNQTEKTRIKLDDRLRSIYNAIFRNVYSDYDSEITVGCLTIDKYTKPFVLDLVNPLKNQR